MATLTATSFENYQIVLRSEDHALLADEPKGAGDGLGPDPYELLLASLGGCTAMTVIMYARRKSWPLEKVHIELSHGRVHARDCEDCEGKEGIVDRIALRLQFDGDLDDQQRERLTEIATRCPVRKTLASQPTIVHELVS
jgi:putative redox protein